MQKAADYHLTEGPITKNLILFSLPMLFETAFPLPIPR